MSKNRKPKRAGIVTAKEKVDTTPPVEQTEQGNAAWQQRAQESQEVDTDETEEELQLDDDGNPIHNDDEGANDSTESTDSDTSEPAESRGVDLFMLTDYRSFAKKGQVYTVDAQKADELIRLKRAVRYDKKAHKKATRAN